MARSESGVEKLIEEARRGRKTSLDLSGHRVGDSLERIPDAVYGLSDLEALALWANKIRVIPERIRDLPNLQQLDLRHNPIEKVPDIPGLSLDWQAYVRCRSQVSSENIRGIRITMDELPEPNRLLADLSGMASLRSLLIDQRVARPDERPRPAGALADLIANIGHFDQLEELWFFSVPLEEIPAGIRGLRRLRWLGLRNAGLAKLPGWLPELRELTALDLWDNTLESLPHSLSEVPRLEHLTLTDNLFSSIPETVFHLDSLKSLWLDVFSRQEGRLKHIPAAILKLTNLTDFGVDGQPIEVPPMEVVNQGLDAIKNYWRQREEAGVDYLCEAKLIVVGEAGAGKTSLAAKIRDPAYELQPAQRSTEGIEVIRWSFPAAVRVKRGGTEELLQREFMVNVWDFGGQEVYHATHQFFLTRRSLYALVADDRKEDTDFHYWLQAVELLSDRSPLLLVQNEKQDRQRDVDLGSLRARFPNLREAHRINLATNRGLEGLVNAIRHELERLPHIGTPLPKTWSRVRAALEKDTRSYIGLEEYLAICEEHGFLRREDKLQLSGYLHDLGICLHFQDDPVLKNIVILKPKWGTDAVYRVLDDHTVLDQRGRFGPADLARLWAEAEYAPMRDELLRLMMKFQLCYQLPESDDFIAPQLLSPSRPAYDLGGGADLVLRYEYDFLPKGLITRFIVAVNHLIAAPGLVWKSGVVLEREGTRGEVVEDYSRRKIVVRVKGPDRQGLLAIVDDQLDRIHRSFTRLQYEKLLPCNCQVCGQRDEPFVYPLSELRDFARQGDQIQCRVSRKMVDAANLIRDVLPSSLQVHEDLATELLRQHERALESESRKEVFVSYAWAPASTAIVDRLEEAFKDRKVTLLRDRNEVRYKDSIRAFMERLGRGKCIVVVLSKAYLESKSCMFELAEIAAAGELRDRVFPIVLADAGIYDASGRLDYVAFWEKKTKELDGKMKEVEGQHLHGIREDLDLYARIRATMAGIVETLGDMNASTAESHLDQDFEQVLRALEARLAT